MFSAIKVASTYLFVVSANTNEVFNDLAQEKQWAGFRQCASRCARSHRVICLCTAACYCVLFQRGDVGCRHRRWAAYACSVRVAQSTTRKHGELILCSSPCVKFSYLIYWSRLVDVYVDVSVVISYNIAKCSWVNIVFTILWWNRFVYDPLILSLWHWAIMSIYAHTKAHIIIL